MEKLKIQTNRQNLIKAFVDARKVGVTDAKSEMLINDYLKTIEDDIIRKENSIKELAGELFALKRQFETWMHLLNRHTKLEIEALKDVEEQKKEKREKPVIKVLKKKNK